MFKDIPLYEWLYSCDELWNIFSYPKKFNFSKYWKILKQSIWTGWYPIVSLYKDWKQKTYKVATLIILTFKGERPKWMQICHNDSNKLNNKIDNLRYWTAKSNIQDEINLWHHVTQTHSNKWNFWNKHQNSKPVLQYILDWTLIKEWENACCAWRELWFNQWHIASCCRWERKSHKWFIWKFKPLPLPPSK